MQYFRYCLKVLRDTGYGPIKTAQNTVDCILILYTLTELLYVLNYLSTVVVNSF